MKLGRNQKHFLTSSIEMGSWPGSGWTWSSYSTGLHLAQSLVAKGLLTPRTWTATKWSSAFTSFELTEDGRELALSLLSPRRREAVLKREAWRNPKKESA